ncbi:MAG TPA: sensor domain-containing diguanylate cyclase [Gaiellaceae bacterium]|nr:sensor domain-containing diguanylate cyclase [Gaiellaceae bacterium]
MILLAIAVALVALVAVVGAVLLLRRSGRRSDDRVAALVENLNSRIDELARELAGAREQAEDELRRNRVLGDLGGSIDLDEVLSRTLEAATQVTGAQAALAWLADPGGPPMVATYGLSQDEAEHQAVAGPPDGRQARAVSFVYRYSPDELERDGDLIRTGLSVPMGGGEEGGYLAVFSRKENDWDDMAVDELEELAERAGPAIENARRFREARQLADLDALTGLHNRRYFHETLAREVARAHRYNRNLALIVFDLDDFKAINDRIGHLAGDSVLADAAARVRDVVRSADIACRVGGDEFGVILPESSLADADQLYRRIQHSVSAQPVSAVGRIGFSAGVAELRPDDDAVSFFQRADQALYQAKESGKGQISSASNAG